MPYGRIILSLLLLLSAVVVPGLAQGQELPLVVFVEDEQLQTASTADEGPDGLKNLQQIFRTLGARTETVTLDSPLPADAQIVVLIRPLRALSVEQLSRLWLHLLDGNNLLVALDPIGLPVAGPERTTAANPDRANSGLASLLAQNYGIGLEDTLVVAPWFSADALTTQTSTFLQAYPEDVVRHPVIEPLAAHDIPVMTWGARTLWSEPVGPSSAAVPLLTQDYGYGETARVVGNDPESLDVNISTDVQGRLLLSALAENTDFDSRLVFLGDSESLLDGYGLAIDPVTLLPVHIGNRIFAERVASWLLENEDWPVLADRLTWLSVDGSGDDWIEPRMVLEDKADDAVASSRDIREVYAFRDDNYLYVRVDTADRAGRSVAVIVEIENNFDAAPDITFVGAKGRVEAQYTSGVSVEVSDAAVAAGDVVELRLPLRVTGTGALIGGVCLAHLPAEGNPEVFDCVEAPPALVPSVNTLAPTDLALAPGPLVHVVDTETSSSLYAAPQGDALAVAQVIDGQILSAVGRNFSTDWLLVRNARFEGWLPLSTVLINSDPAQLPVVQGN